AGAVGGPVPPIPQGKPSEWDQKREEQQARDLERQREQARDARDARSTPHDRFVLWSTWEWSSWKAPTRRQKENEGVSESEAKCEDMLKVSLKAAATTGMKVMGNMGLGKTKNGEPYSVSYRCLPVGVNP